MNKPHFIVCADVTSVGINSNGKASLLRLGAEIQKNNYNVNVVFYLSVVDDPFIPAGHHIINLHNTLALDSKSLPKNFLAFPNQ